MKKYMILLLLIINVIFLTGCGDSYFSDGNTIMYNGDIYYNTNVGDYVYPIDAIGNKTCVGSVHWLGFFLKGGLIYTIDADTEENILIVDEYSVFKKFEYDFPDKETIIESVGCYISIDSFADFGIENESFSSLFSLEKVIINYKEALKYESSFEDHIDSLNIVYEYGLIFYLDLLVDSNHNIYVDIHDRSNSECYHHFYYKVADKYNDLIYNKLLEYNRI